MRLLFSLFFIGLIFSPSAAFGADKVNYWLMDVPVMKGAQNVQREREDHSFSSSLVYELTLSDPRQVYDFYNSYFIKLGWRDFMEDHPDSAKSWNGYSFNVLQDGTAIAGYSDMWNSPNKAFSAGIQLTLTEYDGKDFSGEIVVQITPEMQALGMYEHITPRMELFSEPRDIFIFAKAFSGEFRDISRLDFEKVPEEYKNEKVVLGHKKIVDAIKANFKKFGDQYVDYNKIPKP